MKEGSKTRAFDLHIRSQKHSAFPFSLFLEEETTMNFKLQAKKTPFQRHKEEQELQRKVNLERER